MYTMQKLTKTIREYFDAILYAFYLILKHGIKGALITIEQEMKNDD